MQVQDYKRVEKESLSGEHFFPHEILKSKEEISQRYNDLYKAMLLGNAYHFKVKILFESLEGAKSVETTIWFATDKYIMLKGGMIIPVHCIKQVIF